MLNMAVLLTDITMVEVNCHDGFWFWRIPN